MTSQTSPLDATNQSGESIGNSSFGEEPGTSAGGSGSGVAAPLTIGQQKATAILPEVHPVTGEWQGSMDVCNNKLCWKVLGLNFVG